MLSAHLPARFPHPPGPARPRRHAGLRRLGSGLLAAAVWLVALAGSARAAPDAGWERLPALGAAPQGIGVSGISSGGYMAGQFAVAFSSSVQGLGVVAGGPYACSRGSLQTAMRQCACVVEGALARNFSCSVMPASTYEVYADRAVKRNASRIDPPSDLAKTRVWLFAGGQDKTVDERLVEAAGAFWRRHGVPAEALHLEARDDAGHGFPVEKGGNGSCSLTQPPYINDCKIDGAGELLAWLHPGGPSKAGQPAAGSLHAFSQSRYTARLKVHGLADTGWVYVPRACEAADARCDLHVVFHGCSQAANYQTEGGGRYGMRFIEGSGYNAWAEARRMVVLYPQVQPSDAEVRLLQPGFNPRGCWDFWGYTGADAASDPLRFASRDAPQMRAVKRMVDDLRRAR